MKALLSVFTFLFVVASATPLAAQQKYFKGSWTSVGSTYQFDFDLYLTHKSNNQVEGYFHWKVVNPDENSEMSVAYYKDRIGSEAKEYVRGTYNPATKEYQLKGYRKADPHAIISLDTYYLKVDEEGHIGGTTNDHGTGNGRINGENLSDIGA